MVLLERLGDLHKESYKMGLLTLGKAFLTSKKTVHDIGFVDSAHRQVYFSVIAIIERHASGQPTHGTPPVWDAGRITIFLIASCRMEHKSLDMLPPTAIPL